MVQKTFTTDAIISPNYYFLDGNALPRPSFFNRDVIFVARDGTTVDGKLGRDLRLHKERFLLGWEALSKDKVDLLLSIVEQPQPVEFEVNDGNLRINRTDVVTIIYTIKYITPGSDYLAEVFIGLTEEL